MRITKLTLAAVFASMTTIALASDDFIADCEEFKATNGIDGDCACLADAAEDAGVADEIMAAETLEDLDSLSADAKAAIEGC